MRIRLRFILLLAPLILFLGCETETVLPQAPDGAHTFGGKANDLASGIVALPNNEGFLIVGGQTEKENTRHDYDLLLIRTDMDGNELWTKTFGYPDADEVGWKAIRKPSGEYFIFGTKRYLETGETWFQATMLDADFNLIRQQNTSHELFGTLQPQSMSKIYHLADGNTLAIIDANGFVGKVIFKPDGQVKEQVVLDRYEHPGLGSFCTTLTGGGYALAMKTREGYNVDSFALYLLDEFGDYDRTEYVVAGDTTFQPFANNSFSNGTYHLLGNSFYSGTNVMIQLDSSFHLLLETEATDQMRYNQLIESSSGKLFFAGDASGSALESPRIENIVFKTFDQTHQAGIRTEFDGHERDRILELIRLSDGRFAAVGQTEFYGAGGYDALLIFTNE